MLNREMNTTNSAGTTKSVHTLWAELNTGGTVTTRYLESNGEVVARSNSSTAYWLLTDRLGSVREVLNSSGAIVSEITYGGFGNIQSETNPSLSGNVL
jgi:hypothetical protein